MSLNALQWDGAPGHYEVYYLSATDPRSGVGLWIRYTMPAPSRGAAECALWFMAMDRHGLRAGRRAGYPIAELSARDSPFHLTLAGADLSDRGMAGDFDGVVLDHRSRGRLGWVLRDAMAADGLAHFEYAQRTPVEDVPLLVA
jgi:hypothetical protein